MPTYYFTDIETPHKTDTLLTALINPEFSGDLDLSDLDLTTIQSYRFQDSNLKTIKLPSTLKSLGYSVFFNCNNLMEITIPEGVESIGYGLCRGCTNLEVVNIPSTLQIIPGDAFSNLESISTVNIEKGVKEFKARAFGDSYKSPGRVTFSYSGSMSEWNSITKASNWFDTYGATLTINCSDGTMTEEV